LRGSADGDLSLHDLALRPVRATDLPVLTELATRSASGFNWSGHRTEASLRQRFEEDGYLGEADGWMVAAFGEGPCLASVGWRGVNWSTPPYSRAWNIGLTVRPEYRRRGIGTRAQQLLCDYLFETTSVNRVEAVTNAGNTAEQHALAAAGFTYEGTIRQAEFLFGRWHDLHMFSRLRSEWAPPPLPPGHAGDADDG
jgi:[ribosomal protein S5]-alanine N-acetyltransferase